MSQTPPPRAIDPAPGTPPWVKAFGIAVLAIVLLFATLHLTGNSPLGPTSHTPPIEHRVQQPTPQLQP